MIVSQAFWLFWIAYRSKDDKLLIIASLLQAFVRLGYWFIWRKWGEWVWTGYILEIVFLVMILAVFRKRKIFIGWPIVGMILTTLIFFVPITSDWFAKFSMTRIGIYVCIWPALAGFFSSLKRNHEIFVLALYSVTITISDIIKYVDGGEIERFFINRGDPYIFMFCMFIWVILSFTPLNRRLSHV